MTDTRQTDTTLLGSVSEPLRAPIGLLAPGTALGERYEIRAVLGHGGFAVVYLAHDRELGRDVALKVLREDRLSPGSLSRLKREVRVARDLAHPNVVRVFDIESAGSAVFVSLEAVAGGSLRDRMNRGAIGVEEALRLAAEILQGLAALHGVGIVHRDIKPGNVLLTPEGTVKLADFGLALHLEGDDTRVTATETAVGTLEYLAPEQAMGEPVDARSDLYSAGVVLFEMLTGRLPHAGRSSLGNLIARFREQPPDVADLRPEVPRWLAKLIGRLLATDRAERYPSALAVLRDLERRKVAVRPSRKRRFALVAAGLLVAAAALALWLAAEARGRRFSHVAPDGDNAVVAVDRRGRTLWRRDDVALQGNFVPVRLGQDRQIRLAATLASPRDMTLERSLRIDFLDPRTGESVDRMSLPDGSTFYFSGFAPTYGVRLTPVDLDGDGTDEIVASYSHRPYWPSFSILVEPAPRRARLVFAASGHHHFLGAEDLDGDGRKELLFGGINNRMGWRVGLAALRVDLRAASAGDKGDFFSPATSADRASRAHFGDSLLWYAVGPRQLLRDSGPALTFDAAARRLTLHFFGRTSATFGYDGFLAGTASALDPARRAAARNEAYLSGAEGAQLVDGDHPEDALGYLDEARRQARLAGEPHVEGWIVQLRLAALIASGRPEEAERALAEAIALEPEAASEAALAAAWGWHRAGDLELALAAYRRSETLPGFATARPFWETLEGQVFALVELGRFDDARAVVRSYRRIQPADERIVAPYAEFIAWRSGGSPDPDRIVVNPGTVDLHRYWRLEARAQRGDDPAELREEIGRERSRQSGLGPLLDSLESELLFRTGRPAEAIALARHALAEADANRARDLVLRSHRPILAERLARFERAQPAEKRPRSSGNRRKPT